MIAEYIDGTLGQLLIAHLQELPTQRMTLLRFKEASGSTQGTIELLGFAPAARFAQSTPYGLNVLQIGSGSEVDAIIIEQIRFVPGFIAPAGKTSCAMAS